MASTGNEGGTDENDPVKVQEVLDVGTDDVDPPAELSEQPSLPDFNS